MKKGFDYTGVSVIYFCHDGRGNFLMNKRGSQCRDEHGCWDCGGGGLDFGERVEDGLRREIQEEYCTEVLEYEFLGFRDVHREHDGKKTHWIALDFKVRVDRDKAKNGVPDMHETIEWFRLHDLPRPLHSQMQFTLDKYKDKLR